MRTDDPQNDATGVRYGDSQIDEEVQRGAVKHQGTFDTAEKEAHLVLKTDSGSLLCLPNAESAYDQTRQSDISSQSSTEYLPSEDGSMKKRRDFLNTVEIPESPDRSIEPAKFRVISQSISIAKPVLYPERNGPSRSPLNYAAIQNELSSSQEFVRPLELDMADSQTTEGGLAKVKEAGKFHIHEDAEQVELQLRRFVSPGMDIPKENFSP